MNVSSLDTGIRQYDVASSCRCLYTLCPLWQINYVNRTDALRYRRWINSSNLPALSDAGGPGNPTGSLHRPPALYRIRPGYSPARQHSLTGDPRAAAPAPVAMTSPFFECTMPQVTRSTRRGSTARSPSMNRPQEALSAMVSWILIFQSLMRESTISKQGITHSVARRTAALVTPGPSRSCFRINAISPSALA